MKDFRISDLLDLKSIQKMADAHYQTAGMPIGIIDAMDGSILVGSGWQDICVKFHRSDPVALQSCRESNSYIKKHLAKDEPVHYKCKNGLWDIGMPIIVDGRHMATLFLGQFFYEGEVPDRKFFIDQANKFGFDVDDYLAALDRVPIFSREKVQSVLEYDKTLASFIADLAQNALSRIQADESIRESERKFHAVFDQANQFLGLLALDGRVLEANRTALHFGGLPESDMIGKPLWKTPLWPHSEELQEKAQLAVQLAAKGKLVSFESSHHAADGKLYYFDFSLKPVRDENGQVVLLMLEGRDITSYKLAEEEIGRQAGFLQVLIDAMPYPVFYKDRQGRYLGCNRAFEQIQEMRSDEVAGKTVRDVAPKELADIVTRADEELLKKPGTQIYEGIIESPSGERRDVIFHKATFEGPEGTPAGIVSALVDITARRQAEKILEESEAKTRAILDNIGLGVAMISPDMEVLELNRRMREWFPSLEVDQHPLCYLSLRQPPRDEICENCPVCRTLKDGRVHEITIQTAPPGGVRHMRVISSPIVDAAGRTKAVVEIVEDITEKLSLEAQFRQAQKMEAVGRLAGGVAHDFNNMLGVILGYAELALNKIEPGHPLHADLASISIAARRSTDIIRQLLAFARKQTIAPKTLDLNEAVEGILKMLRHLIGEDIDLIWRPYSGLWPVKMDPTQIEQILANLCVNARDAIAGVGKITIETRNHVLDEAYCADHPGFKAGSYAMLAVSDDGCGMDAENLDKIFEPFYTTKGVGQGTGLGLATVYGAVKQNDGFINVYSEKGKGTTFKIYLRRQADPIVDALIEHQGKIHKGRGETILLVEDEEVVLELAARMLNGLDYHVLSAPSPAEALRLSAEHPGEIHLLLTDVILPEMNGKDVALKLRQGRPDMKCLYMSGYTADVIAHRGMLDPGVHFIPKPFSVLDLSVKVRETLDN